MTVSNRPINSCSSVQGCNRVSLSAGWPRTTVYPMTPSPLANIVRGIATLTPSASAAVSLGTYRNTKQLKADSCSTSNRGFSSASAKSRVRSTIGRLCQQSQRDPAPAESQSFNASNRRVVSTEYVTRSEIASSSCLSGLDRAGRIYRLCSPW